MGFHFPSVLFVGPRWLLLLLAVVVTPPLNGADSNCTVRVVASNLTGNSQKYEASQIRVLQGVQPDIAAIQEFNYLGNTSSDIRTFVDTAFGTNFVYYRESGYSIPNGIISRWPILTSGSWPDSLVPNRGFAWAQVDLPGSNDLYVVSVHLYSSGNATDRNNEATAIRSLVQSNFPANAWVIVAGDLNTGSRTEAAVTTFKTFLSDDPVPTDAESDADTNLNRNKPYDYVLPSFSMTNTLVNTVIGSHSFPKGLVFDSRVYTPLSEVAPIQWSDSAQGQHMAVIKDFQIQQSDTNAPPVPPSITDEPDDLSIFQGGDAVFFITTTGTSPLTYQWCFDGADIPGANTQSYTNVNVQPMDAGGYTVVVTNTAGSATSRVAVLTVIPPGTGTGDVLAQWNFNSVPPDGDTTTGTLNPSVGSGSASVVGGVGQTFFSGAGSQDPAALDNSALGTANYPPQGTGNKTAGVQFNVSTVGKENLVIVWDQRASNTGSRYSRLQYSADGTTFVDHPLAFELAGAGSFYSATNDLAELSGVADNPDFAFRIVTEFQSTATGTGLTGYAAANPTRTYGTGGTQRFDWVTVLASTINAPLPQQAILSEPRYTNGEFQFGVMGTPGASYVIEASTNLALGLWTPLSTNLSPFTYADPNIGVAPWIFYRASSLP